MELVGIIGLVAGVLFMLRFGHIIAAITVFVVGALMLIGLYTGTVPAPAPQTVGLLIGVGLPVAVWVLL